LVLAETSGLTLKKKYNTGSLGGNAASGIDAE
jgi:hypothetical protein